MRYSNVWVGAYALLAGVLLGAAVAKGGGRNTADSSLPNQVDDDLRETGTGMRADDGALRDPCDSEAQRPVMMPGSARQETRAALGRSGQESAGTIQNAGSSRMPSLSAALEPLTAERLKNRVIDVFPAAYLTLMAIIQGAALAILISSTSSLLANRPSPVPVGVALTQSLGTGLTLVIVSHEYLLLTMVVRWVPTTFDTLIPYLLGLGEIWMALATGHIISWWAALSSMCLVAIFAFWHTKIRMTEDNFGDRHVDYRRNRQFITFQIYLSVVMLAVSGDALLLNSYRLFPEPLNICLMWLVILMGLAVLTLGEYSQNKLYDVYLIPRWRPRKRTRRGSGSRPSLPAYSTEDPDRRPTGKTALAPL